ncbi:hypothetical protein NRA32_05555 [Acinetobacter baumannii]|nr:hypothetical protein [Acinetobacter baumannii]
MKPEQFIREFGVEKAREVVDGAPSKAESYQDGYYFRAKPEFQFHNGIHDQWNLTDNNGEYFKNRGFDQVAINDLKRLVESVDMLKRFGGIELSKEWILEYSSFPYRVELEQAIADYEAIYES